MPLFVPDKTKYKNPIPYTSGKQITSISNLGDSYAIGFFGGFYIVKGQTFTAHAPIANASCAKVFKVGGNLLAIFYASTGTTTGAYSTDNGATWQTTSTTITQASIGGFAQLPTGRVVISSGGSGPSFQYTDDGITWSADARIGFPNDINTFATAGTSYLSYSDKLKKIVATGVRQQTFGGVVKRVSYIYGSADGLGFSQIAPPVAASFDITAIKEIAGKLYAICYGQSVGSQESISRAEFIAQLSDTLTIEKFSSGPLSPFSEFNAWRTSNNSIADIGEIAGFMYAVTQSGDLFRIQNMESEFVGNFSGTKPSAKTQFHFIDKMGALLYAGQGTVLGRTLS